jgi:hypothetical protein
MTPSKFIKTIILGGVVPTFDSALKNTGTAG